MKSTRVKKIGIWFLAFSLFAFHLLFRSVAHADDKSWQRVFSKDGACQISFPVAPQLIQQSLPLSDGLNSLNYDVYLAPHGEKGVFLLLVATYPMPLSGGHEVAGLEGLLSGIVNHNAENKLVYANLVELHNHQAVDFLIEGGNSYFRGQAVMIGSKLYLIALEGIKGTVDHAAFNQFLKSFKLSK